MSEAPRGPADTSAPGSEPLRAVKLRHPSAVTHVRKINDHLVLVNGLRSSVMLYDLRFPHPPSPSRMFPCPTSPCMVYEGHDNEYRTRLGFDVDLEMGLVAAARDDGGVSVWGLHGGEKIDVPALAPRPGSATTEIQRSGCLRFSPSAVEGLSNLLVARSGLVEEYSW